MKDLQKWFKLEPDHLEGVDRVAIMGRRGTGKSVGVKQAIADGLRALWIVDSKGTARDFPADFVKPNEADVLPAVELVDGSPDSPQFRFGAGYVRVMALSAVVPARQHGAIVVDGQANVIIQDEVIRVDGRYPRACASLLDDLAGTVGRTGVLPKIVVLGNPIDNDNPYSWTWRINTTAAGIYEDDSGKLTRVIGTSDCRDCFGRRIGIDAVDAPIYADRVNVGGVVVIVNGRALRIIDVKGWIYAGDAVATGDEPVLVDHDRLTHAALTGRGCKLIVRCRDAAHRRQVVYSSFNAELIFSELLGRR